MQKSEIRTKNTLAVKKVATKTRKEKYVKSKGGGQGMLLITLTILIMMTQAANHYHVINSIPAQAWSPKLYKGCINVAKLTGTAIYISELSS